MERGAPAHTATMIQLRPVHKLLHKKLRIPQHLVRPVLSRIKVVASRGEHAERLALAREIQQSSPEASSIPELLGYRRFDADELSELTSDLGPLTFRPADAPEKVRAGTGAIIAPGTAPGAGSSEGLRGRSCEGAG